MALTYTLITSQVLNTNTTNVYIDSIPNTYTDLLLKTSMRSTNSTSDLLYVKVNGVGTSLYSSVRLMGNGSSITSNVAQGSPFEFGYQVTGSSATTNTFSSFEFYIPSYNLSQSKPMGGWVVNENAINQPVNMMLMASLFRSTSGVNSLELFPGFGSFVPGSSFYLYGINNS